MSAAKRVIKNTGILYARMAITVVLSLYTTRIVLDALGVEDFGIFSLVGGVIAMLTFLNASMAAATQRFMSFAEGQGDERRQHQIFNVSVVLHAGIALLILGIIEIAGWLLFDGVLKIQPERVQAAWMVYQFSIASTFFTILSVPYDAVINARENMLLFAILGIIEAVLKLIIALIIVNATTDKLELYGLLMAVIAVALLVMRAAYCHRRYQECEYGLRRYFSRPLFKEMTSFAGWSLLGSSTSMLANYGQGLVLNVFFGAKVNTAQALVGQISGQLGVLSTVMLRVINPFITKSEGSGNRELMIQSTMTASKMSFFLLAVVYIPVLIEMPYLFDLWLKEVPPYTILFCYLLLTRNLVEQLYITLIISISAVGNIKTFQVVYSGLTLLPLPITYFLFSAGYAPYAIYVVFLLYSIVTFALVIKFSQRLCDLPVKKYFNDVVLRGLAVFIISLAIAALPTYCIQQDLIRLIVISVTSTITIFTLIWYVGLCRDERRIISSMVSTFRARIAAISKK